MEAIGLVVQRSLLELGFDNLVQGFASWGFFYF